MIDLARIGYVIACIAYAAAGGDGVGAVALGAAAVVLIRFARLPRLLDASFVAGMAVFGWSEALRLDQWAWLDSVIHSFVALVGAPVAYVMLARIDVVPDPAVATARQYAGVFTIALAIGLAVGALWELVEFASDRVAGTTFQLGLRDTMRDLAADLGGAAAAGAALVVWAARR